RGELLQEAIADLAILAHADDAAAAHGDASLPHPLERLQAIVVGTGGDDAGVEVRGGVEVVVVGGQPGGRQRVGLRLVQHAERAALHLVGAVMLPVGLLRAEDQIRQRRRVDRRDLRNGPVVTKHFATSVTTTMREAPAAPPRRRSQEWSVAAGGAAPRRAGIW